MNSNPDSQSPTTSNEAPPVPELPALHTTDLDVNQVEQLLRDIETCTELIEIVPKYSARGRVPDAGGLTLENARELLASRSVRGIQLRYQYDGAEWWDTLIAAGDGFRVVRIRHDFASADAG